MSNSAYDIHLGDKAALRPYRVKSFVRDSAPQIAPRFSTGSQGQTDLDLLKSASVDNLSGGMFQREFDDPRMVSRAIGIFNKQDEYLYPALPPEAISGTFSGAPAIKAESTLQTYVMATSFSAGTYTNKLRLYDSFGGCTDIPLPGLLSSNGFQNASGMCLHKKYLFVGSANGIASAINCFRYDTELNTWQDIGLSFVLFATLRGMLYAIGPDNAICSITNETAAGVASFAIVDFVGASSLRNLATDAKEYNGALWIAKPDGLYRFDGVKAIKVLELVTQQLQVFNGALYFVSGNWLYKFDGTNVNRIQFFGNKEVVPKLGLSANADYLFVQTSSRTSDYSNSDKGIASSATGLRRIYMFDGASWYLLNEAALTFGTGYTNTICTTSGYLFDIYTSNGTPGSIHNKYSLANVFTATAVTASSALDVTLSDFDDGFPNIFKSLELIEANYSGMITGDSLAVTYQIHDGKTWSSWISAGTLTSTSDNTLEITNFSNKLFKALKINFTATLAPGSSFRFKGGSFRFTLQPRTRWRWNVGLLAQGGLVDRNNVSITSDANELTNYIHQSIKQKTPSFMLAPDYGIIKAGVSAAATSFVVNGRPPLYTDPYNEYQLIAVKNSAGTWEILRVATAVYNPTNDDTTITVLERGYIGITAATINANAEFHLCFKVYVNRLMRDATILDNNTYNEQATGESQLNREFIIELIEV